MRPEFQQMLQAMGARDMEGLSHLLAAATLSGQPLVVALRGEMQRRGIGDLLVAPEPADPTVCALAAHCQAGGTWQAMVASTDGDFAFYARAAGVPWLLLDRSGHSTHVIMPGDWPPAGYPSLSHMLVCCVSGQCDYVALVGAGAVLARLMAQLLPQRVVDSMLSERSVAPLAQFMEGEGWLVGRRAGDVAQLLERGLAGFLCGVAAWPACGGAEGGAEGSYAVFVCFLLLLACLAPVSYPHAFCLCFLLLVFMLSVLPLFPPIHLPPSPRMHNSL